jgi:hypothetical protein
VAIVIDSVIHFDEGLSEPITRVLVGDQRIVFAYLYGSMVSEYPVSQNELAPDSVPLKAAKYILIELAEAMSNVIQHILAKGKGIAVSGYIDAVVKAHDNGIIKRIRGFAGV